MRKINFLLATIMMLVGITAQAATITITWDLSQLQPFEIYLHDGQSTTKDGVTLKAIESVAVVDPDDGFMMMGNNGGDSFEFSLYRSQETSSIHLHPLTKMQAPEGFPVIPEIHRHPLNWPSAAHHG